MELEMMLTSAGRARAFADSWASGAMIHLFPEASRVCDDAEKIRPVLAALSEPCDFDLAMAAMLHRLSAKQAESACLALRCSNQTRKIVGWLISHQNSLSKPREINLADLKLVMAHPACADLLALFHAKLKAVGASMSPYRTIVKRMNDVAEKDIAPPPLLTGNDLSRLGLPAGPLYKRILDQVYYEQLNETVRNKPDARKLATQLIADNRRKG
jgi:hypothetical protein